MEEEYLMVIEKEYEEELKNIKIENEKLNKQKIELENKLFEKINDNKKIINKYEKQIIELNDKLSNTNIIRTQPTETTLINTISEEEEQENFLMKKNNVLDRLDYYIIKKIFEICGCLCIKKIKD